MIQDYMTTCLSYELYVPVRPLAEQQPIVSKLDELTQLCDRLEACLAGDDTRRGLLDAQFAEALYSSAMLDEAA